MSPLFGLAPMFGLVGVAVILVAGSYIARRIFDAEGLPRFWSLKGCALNLVVAIFLFPLLTAASCAGLIWVHQYEGRDVSPAEVNEILTFVDVPAEATDIVYRHSDLLGTVDSVEFTISKEDFLDWMRANDRQPHRIYEPNDRPDPPPEGKPFDSVYPLDIAPYDTPDSIKVEEGYRYSRCDEKHADACLHITYDEKNKRAYVRRTIF